MGSHKKLSCVKTDNVTCIIIIIIIISLQSYRQKCLLTDLHVLTSCRDWVVISSAFTGGPCCICCTWQNFPWNNSLSVPSPLPEAYRSTCCWSNSDNWLKLPIFNVCDLLTYCDGNWFVVECRTFMQIRSKLDYVHRDYADDKSTVQ